MTLTRPRARIQCDNAEGSNPPNRAIVGYPERYPLEEVLDERTASVKIFGEQNPGPFG